MFKVGDKVRVQVEKAYNTDLTNGNVYTVISVDNHYGLIAVINDLGKEEEYSKCRFEWEPNSFSDKILDYLQSHINSDPIPTWVINIANILGYKLVETKSFSLVKKED